MHFDSLVFAKVDSSKLENVVHFLEDAIKGNQWRQNYKEVADTNIKIDVIIKGSFNTISQEFALNERQEF